VDLDGPKEAQVQSYLPGGANVPSWEGTLVPPGESIEPSVCCGNAALCQITFTACLMFKATILFVEKRELTCLQVV